MSVEVLATQRKNLLKDVAFNANGERMATCSEDEIKVWNMIKSSGWNLSDEWKDHNESLLRIVWAPSELGEILATCSSNGSTSIWEEIGTDKKDSDQPKMWIRRAKYSYSQGIISDLKFAPSEFGLILTTCSTNGFLRFYNVPNILDKSEWKLQHTTNCEKICKCVTWSNSNNRTSWPLIAVGCEGNVPGAHVEYDPDYDAGLTTLIFLYEYQVNIGNYALVKELGTNVPVRSLSFAPTLGPPYRFLAIATLNLEILCIMPDPEAGYQVTQMIIGDECPDDDIRVVDWNLDGESCVATYDDGTVRVWEGPENVWRIVAEIRTNDNSEITVEGMLSDGSEIVTVPANLHLLSGVL